MVYPLSVSDIYTVTYYKNGNPYLEAKGKSGTSELKAGDLVFADQITFINYCRDQVRRELEKLLPSTPVNRSPNKTSPFSRPLTNLTPIFGTQERRLSPISSNNQEGGDSSVSLPSFNELIENVRRLQESRRTS